MSRLCLPIFTLKCHVHLGCLLCIVIDFLPLIMYLDQFIDQLDCMVNFAYLVPSSSIFAAWPRVVGYCAFTWIFLLLTATATL
ncbi:hypothetical protein DsansV1_C14g0131271 [Dioscorea sansibarensis]